MNSYCFAAAWRLLVAGAVLVFTSPAAQAADFYLALSVGGGDVEVDLGEFTDNPDVVDELAGDGVFGSELSLGWHFDSGLMLDLSQDEYDTFSFAPFAPLLIGKVDYSATRVAVGFAPKTENRVGFVGKLGVAFYDLELTESPFLNPGSEDTASRNGESIFVQLGAEVRVMRNFNVGGNFDFTEADFGRASALRLQLRYTFK